MLSKMLKHYAKGTGTDPEPMTRRGDATKPVVPPLVLDDSEAGPPPPPVDAGGPPTPRTADRMQSAMTELLLEQSLLEHDTRKGHKFRAKTLADKLGREKTERRLEYVTAEIAGLRKELRKVLMT